MARAGTGIKGKAALVWLEIKLHWGQISLSIIYMILKEFFVYLVTIEENTK